MDIYDAQQFIEKEKEAEMYATPFVYGVNFSDCLRMYGIETEIEVDGKKIQAHRIYGLWETYLIAQGQVTGTTITTKTKGGKEKHKPVAQLPDVFTGVSETHQSQMYVWLTTNYTEVYKSIVTPEEQSWLKKVIRFVVYRRIMESKYHKWITTGKGFADTEISRRIGEIYRFRYEMPNIARLINTKLLAHKERTAEDWEKKLSQEIIMGVFDLLREDRLRLMPPPHPNEILQIEGGEAV